MAGHPQGSNRGIKSYKAISSGSLSVVNSTGTTAIVTNNSTGIKLDGGLQLNGKSTGQLKANSTAITLAGALRLSGKSTGQLSYTSTAGVIVSPQMRVGTKATYISSNSTGVKLGGKYISGNTTAN